jgi:hypothetical protein
MSIIILGDFLTISKTTNTLDITSKNVILENGKNMSFSAGTTLTIKGDAYLPDISSIYFGNTATTITNSIGSGIPQGCIMIWYGSAITIPSGWAACDGLNGTPNLKDLFIIGTDTNHAGTNTAYPQGTTLGNVNNAVSITTSHLPEHTHTGTTAPGGTAHSHTFPRDNGTSGISLDAVRSTANTQNSRTKATSTNTHTHTLDTQSTGLGNSKTILPPYYALIYIIKV